MSHPSRTYATAHLDAVRGLAALAVLAYHIRYNFFVDYSEVAAPTAADRAFYALTSFGHDAVMVFFVLSGYLISGTILKDLTRRDWSWGRYLVNRLTRLYVVLIPALLLTVFWDALGLRFFSMHPAYTGAPQNWIHNFFPVADRLTPGLFFANLGFLQAISGTPPFGTAGQLWSLSYEFGYYLMFPAALVAVWPGTPRVVRVVCVAATAILAYHFGVDILVRFPIWLLGVLVRVAPRINALRNRSSMMLSLAVALVMVAAIAWTHTPSARGLIGTAILNIDYAIGVVVALALYVLVHDERPLRPTTYVHVARWTAQISYTLYLTHLSLLIFLRASFIEGRPWEPGLATVLAAAAVFAIVTVYAVAVWFVAEAQTDRVRHALAERFVNVRDVKRAVA